MEDIESRIAELFHERLGQFRQVVTDVDVKEIIVLMGEPRDYALEEFEQDDLLFIDKDSVYLSAASVSIIRDGSLSEFEISMQKISNGPTGKKAVEYALAIGYNCNLVGNELYLPSYYSFPVADKIRGQRVVLEVRVPEDKYIIMKNYDDDFHGEVRTKSMRRVEDESKWCVWTTKQDEVADSVTEKD